MRLFLTLCALVAVVSAKPQYNYGTGVSGSFGSGSGGYSGGNLLGAPTQQGGFSSFHGPAGHSGGVNSGFSSGSSYGPTGGQSGYSSSLHTGSSSGGFSTGGLAGLSSGGNQGLSGGGFSSGGGLLGGSFGGLNSGSSSFNSHSQSSHSTTHQAPLVHKQFITITAPEDNSSLEQSKHLVLGRAQKNYRVIFIKAPSSNSASVKLSAEYAPKEEKTVIYVLTKKDSSLEINDIATPAPTQPSKPEVYFIKYKSDQEAQHAQHEIQAQYDSIEGTSEHVDGGIAQQKSVVGILDGGNNGGHVDQGGLQQISSTQFGTNNVALEQSGSSGTSSKVTAYLPPSK